MKKLLYLLVSLVFIATLYSCDSIGINKREQDLFIQDFQTKLIRVDTFDRLGDLTDFLSTTYCDNHEQEWPYIIYDFKAKKVVSESNRNTLMLGVEAPPCVEGRFDARMILEIVKDGYNTEIENFITEVDSIPIYVERQMLSFGKNPNYAVGAMNNGIWLSTKRDDKLVNLNPYIYNIIVGYLSSVRKYSKMAYLKEIDDLSDEEYAEIAREFNFRIAFKYTDKPIELKLQNEDVI